MQQVVYLYNHTPGRDLEYRVGKIDSIDSSYIRRIDAHIPNATSTTQYL